MTIVLLVVALTVYGQDKHSETYIRQRIATIYQGVGKSTYDAEGNRVDYIHSPFNRDSAYCSQQISIETFFNPHIDISQEVKKEESVDQYKSTLLFKIANIRDELTELYTDIHSSQLKK